MPEEIIDIRRTTPPIFIRYFSGMGLSSTNLKILPYGIARVGWMGG